MRARIGLVAIIAIVLVGLVGGFGIGLNMGRILKARPKQAAIVQQSAVELSGAGWEAQVLQLDRLGKVSIGRYSLEFTKDWYVEFTSDGVSIRKENKDLGAAISELYSAVLDMRAKGCVK
jgi:hypothetical protein